MNDIHRKSVRSSDTAELRVRVTGIGLLAFITGALNPLSFNLLGEMYGPEVMLPFVALSALVSRGGTQAFREKLFWFLLLAIGLMLGGYVMSDLIQQTRPDQFIRGWGRIALLAADFIAMAIIVLQDRRNLWWFALGMGVGGVIYLRVVQHLPLPVWKFGYAEPMLLVAAALGCFLPMRLAAAWLVALGCMSMWWDFRSFAAICFMLAAYLWVRSARPQEPLAGGRRSLALIMASVLVFAVVLAALTLTESSYTEYRRAESNAGRSAAFETGLFAISQSPIVGYGSWTEDRELAQLYLKKFLEKRKIRDPNAESGKHFSPHSQILQAWVEGGILGAAFFIFLGYRLLRAARWGLLMRPADYVTPILLYFYVSCFWNLFMSPFAAPHRIQIALGVVVVLLIESEQRSARHAVNRQPVTPPRRPEALSMSSRAALHWRDAP